MVRNTSAAALMNFLRESQRDERISPLMAAHLSRIVESVLGAKYGSSWRQVDIDSIDIATVFDAYLKSNPGLKESTQEEYRRRFERAISLFQERIAETSMQSLFVARSVDTELEPRSTASSMDRNCRALVAAKWQGDLITYPFPLRPGCVVSLQLPADLESAEIDRLVAFLKTLAMDG